MSHQPHTATILLSDRILHIACRTRDHAQVIAESYCGALEAQVSRATGSEIELVRFARAVPGGTLVDSLRIDDYISRLEQVAGREW